MEPNTFNASKPVPWIRNFELAAVAPDLFDVTYYSIEPHFYKAHGTRTTQRNGGAPVLLADLGQHGGGGDKNNNYDVALQMGAPFAAAFAAIPDYVIKSDANFGRLLTGWVTTGAYNYDISQGPPGLFSTCNHEPKANGVPGCVEGGRAGYSVKLVSRNFLIDSAALSTDGTNPGPLQNPPDNF
jgi:hypothetical protein